ncbi:endospore germination permease [Bacillus sp. REN3]|uniref:GerAB/ArcD/ProY family transporter n=1 Tax=Bacillus sp. REN3 TaxID=2802440 RepID=UPI001AED6AEA|nr:endospore germination permease [Bacillus sp. REN3]
MEQKKDEKINVILGLFIIITAAGIVSHVIVIPAILDEAGRDAWISVLLIGPLLLVWILLLFFIQKKTGQQHLFLWISEKGSKVSSYILAVLICLFLLATAAVSFIDTVSWATTTYLARTPTVVISTSLAVICLLPALNGIRSVAVINCILLPLVLIFGIMVALGNIPNKDYGMLRPFLENGWKRVMRGTMDSGAGIFELFFVLLFQHKIGGKFSLKSLLITGMFLVILTIGPLMGSIAIFGPMEAAKQRFPAYEQWAMLNLGRYLEHLDFISIYQWMVGIFIRISLLIYLIPEMFNFKGKKRVIIQIFIAFFLSVSVLINPMSDMAFLSFLKNYFLPFSSFFLFLITVFLSLYVVIKTKKKGGRSQ